MAKLIEILCLFMIAVSTFVSAGPAAATTVEYDLTIAYTTLAITGKSRPAMTINGSIPGPTLRFREGDFARIRVQNKMTVETSIHWHGLLVPNEMDGVPYVTFPPIAPGTTFTYEFPIRQSGTYWYHSHTSLQEQSGVYGSIVIEPRDEIRRAGRDYVVLLSDWTDEDPHEVLRTLKRGSEWYGIKKGSAQSIAGAVRLGMLGDYLKRELQRMPAMDISDVAYDSFLANGRPELSFDASPGETVRIRIIDGSATTYFHLEFAGGPMTIIAADGQDIEPVAMNRFLIAVAETYDVLITVPFHGSYELRATAHDGSGRASVWIGSGERHSAPDVPKPNLYQAMGDITIRQMFALTPEGVMGMSDRKIESGAFDHPGMMDMDHTSDMHSMPQNPSPAVTHTQNSVQTKDHSMHMMPADKSDHKSDAHGHAVQGRPSVKLAASGGLAIDGMDPRRPWPPYDNLRSLQPTAFSPDTPVREIRLTLDGDMERYVWFIDQTPLSESDSILIRQNEIVRFIMINRTMMHHPMHLHGHFFRVVNAHGDYSPLKHTVNVAPMSTTVIEFDANEYGDWFFHCHLLYHMKSGMARVVHYDGFLPNPDVTAVRPYLYRDAWYIWGQADIMSTMTQGMLILSNTRNIFSVELEAGWHNIHSVGWEITVLWDRYVNRFFTFFAGADFTGSGDDIDDARAVGGIRYLLPLAIESRAWIDSDGRARFILGKHLEIAPRLTLEGEAEYDTHEQWEGRVALSYAVSNNIALIGQWHSEFDAGFGLRIRF